MTAEEKQQIRLDLKTMRQVEVGHKWGITRQRVHQILNEDPSKLNQRCRPCKRSQDLIRFPGKHARFNNPNLQAEVLRLCGTAAEIAVRMNTTLYVIQRIRRTSGPRKAGRPKKFTPDELRERKAARVRAFKAANPERVKAYAIRNYELHRDMLLQRSRENYQKNKEKRKATNKKWLHANMERAREASRKWKAANPDKVRDQRVKEKAKRQNLTRSAVGVR